MSRLGAAAHTLRKKRHLLPIKLSVDLRPSLEHLFSHAQLVCPPPLMHLLRLGQLALGPVQDPQKVVGVEGGRVVRSQRLLVPGQRPYVHLLRLGQLALVPIQDPEIVDGVEGTVLY